MNTGISNNNMSNFGVDALLAMQRLNPSLLGTGTLQPSSFSSGPGAACYAPSSSFHVNDNQAATASLYQQVLNEQQRRLSSGLVSSSLENPVVTSSSAAVELASLVQSKFDSTVTAPSRRRKANFAEKLHAVLSNQACRHAIAWLPSGRSFSIIDQDEFVKTVLPKYFREAKFESFSRRLKRWGFRKVYTTGMQQSIFSHDLFHRDRPDLAKIMNGRDRATASVKNGPAFKEHAASVADDILLQKANAYQQQQMIDQQQRAAALLMAARQSSSPAAPISSAVLPINPALNFMTHQRRVTSSPGSMLDVAAQKQVQEVSRRQSISDELASCEARLKILQQMKAEVTESVSRVSSASPRGLSPSV